MVLQNKNIFIQDTCVLFDLIDLDLLGPFFEMEPRVNITQQVLSDIKKEQQLPHVQKYIDEKKITCRQQWNIRSHICYI